MVSKVSVKNKEDFNGKNVWLYEGIHYWPGS